MAKKKRKKIDDFLQARKQSQEAALEEQTQLSNRIFRICVGATVVLLLLALLEPRTVAAAVSLAVLFGTVAGVGTLALKRLSPRLFPGPTSFNRFVLIVLATVLAFRFMLALDWSEYLAPLPVLAMVLGMAYSQAAGILVVPFIAVYMALLAPAVAETPAAGGGVAFDVPLALVLALGGVVSVLGVHRVRRQSRPAVVGFWAGLVQALGILCFRLIEPGFVLSDLRDPQILRGPGLGFAGGLIAGGILTSVLPAVERFLGVVTERRLLELADPSNRLLRVLRERAPGTFQHTLGVQQLARNAAEATGADVLLAEVGAYYHDIGKICKPEYFVENMEEDRSIHDRLRPSMSKMIIISHVKDGILLAREEKLPEKIVDMIPMHHGTTVIEFFYRKAREESGAGDAPGEDVTYRYPGPKPQFPEAGILMLADAVEAIAKTISEPTSNRFRDMVRTSIMKRLEDGQLDECPLTIADLRKIEDSFVRTLTKMYHGRIDYGDEASGAADRRQRKPAPAGGRDAGSGSDAREAVKGARSL